MLGRRPCMCTLYGCGLLKLSSVVGTRHIWPQSMGGKCVKKAQQRALYFYFVHVYPQLQHGRDGLRLHCCPVANSVHFTSTLS